MIDYNKVWEETKLSLRDEFDRIREENSDLRTRLELAQEELRQAARQNSLYLDRCPKCGYSEVDA